MPSWNLMKMRHIVKGNIQIIQRIIQSGGRVSQGTRFELHKMDGNIGCLVNGQDWQWPRWI